MKKYIFLLLPFTSLAFLGLLTIYRASKFLLPPPKRVEQSPVVVVGSDVPWM